MQPVPAADTVGVSPHLLVHPGWQSLSDILGVVGRDSVLSECTGLLPVQWLASPRVCNIITQGGWI